MNKELLKNGFIELNLPFCEEFKSFVLNNDYEQLDRCFLEMTKPTGRLYSFLKEQCDFVYLEHIIALRSAPLDEDGIWHDDGSRIFGFSLSLNLNPEKITGGELYFRLKNSEDLTIFSPRPFGKIIIFLTGQFGYEHKVTQVTSGKRLVVAGWGSNELFNYN
jgi:hypothetical protein